MNNAGYRGRGHFTTVQQRDGLMANVAKAEACYERLLRM